MSRSHRSTRSPFTRALFCLAALGSSCVPVSLLAADTVTGVSGPPFLRDEAFHSTTSSVEAEREYFASQIEFKTLQLSPEARIALAPARRTAVGLIIDRAADGGLQIYLDRDSDWSLDDEQPVPMLREGDDLVARFEGAADTELLAIAVTPPHDGPPSDFRVYRSTAREGTIQVRELELPFRLNAYAGNYTSGGVCIDLNGDGTLDLDEDSEECLDSFEPYVTIFGQHYRYAVALDGDHLKLRPTNHPASWSHVLPVSGRAPGFAFKDLHGNRRHLRDYRGHVVLLEFWGVQCVTNVEQKSALIKAYDRHYARGLEIIGIAYGEAKDVREYVAERKIRWPQSPQGDREHIFDLYRVHWYPAYVLIGRDGRLIGRFDSVEDVTTELEAAVEDPASPGPTLKPH